VLQAACEDPEIHDPPGDSERRATSPLFWFLWPVPARYEHPLGSDSGASCGIAGRGRTTPSTATEPLAIRVSRDRRQSIEVVTSWEMPWSVVRSDWDCRHVVAGCRLRLHPRREAFQGFIVTDPTLGPLPSR
jgi:hypothetical protein